MDATVIGALFLASVVNAGLPGPCVLLTMGRTAGSGWRAGTAVSCGILAADLLLVGVAMAMMVGVLTLSPSALVAMKWAGIAALVGLAARSLAPAAGPRPAGLRPSARDGARNGAAGLAVGLSSPYNLVFYLALLPQFLPDARPGAAALAAICVAVISGAAVSQAGAVLVGIGCAGLGAAGGRWADRSCAAALLIFAAVAAVAPAMAPTADTGPKAGILVSAR